MTSLLGHTKVKCFQSHSAALATFHKCEGQSFPKIETHSASPPKQGMERILNNVLLSVVRIATNFVIRC